MLKKLLGFIFLLTSVCSYGQAGKGVYQFLDLPVSSRIAALGSANVSLYDNDLNFAFENPALLTTLTNKMLALNMANYLADIKFGSAMYGFNRDSSNYFALGIHYVDYGKFDKRDENNVDEGSFTAKDMALHAVYAHRFTQRVTAGVTFKPIYSVYESYTSFGIAFDAGVSYNSASNLFSAGLVLKNMGTQLKGYYTDEDGQHYESLPFQVQAGFSKKFAHAPLRLSFTLHNLQKFNLDYESTNQTDDDTETTSKVNWMDMAFRHVIVSAEFLPTKNFYLTAAYNHRRHQEMKIDGFKSMAGWSFGGGIKIYKFQVGFGMTPFQKGNYAYQFSIATSLSEFHL